MDQALRLAASLSDNPRRFLAEQCSSRGQAAYVNQREAREMAVDLVVAGTTFEIPGGVQEFMKLRDTIKSCILLYDVIINTIIMLYYII